MRTFNINTPWKNHKYCNSIITNLYRKINLIPETSKRIYNLEKSGFLELNMHELGLMRYLKVDI